MTIEGAELSWRYWEDESGRLVTQMSNWPQNEFILQKYSLDIQISNYVTNVFINLLTSPASALKVLMTLQGLHLNKFISRVTYFNVANLNLHLSPKWSKIKVQKTFNLFFDYKTLETLESSGQEWWTYDGYFTGYCRPPNHSWKPLQAHFQGQSHLQGLLCLTGSSGFLVSPPQPHPPAALQVWGFPRDYSIHIQRLMPQEGFFSWIFLFPICQQHQKQDASTELSLCHALVTHSLHRSYSRDTNHSPKACKGHEGEACGLEKKEQHLELLSGTEEITFISSRWHETFPI